MPAAKRAKTRAGKKASKKRATARARPRADSGRPTTLTPETQERILEALRAGNYFSTACECANVPAKTGYEWLARGEGRDPDRLPTEPFAGFAAAVKRAESEGELASLARIRRAAEGGGLRERKVIQREVKGKTGQTLQKIVETTESFAAPVWQADAWLLERRNPERWGRKDRHDIASPGSDAVEVNVNVSNLINKIYGDAPSEETQADTDSDSVT